MKRTLIINLILGCFHLTFGQQVEDPRVGFTYQALAIDKTQSEGFGRDTQGKVLANQDVRLRFNIREGSDGKISYQEVHATSTDAFGIFRLVIGRGESISGVLLEELNWGQQAYFLEIEIDLGDGFKPLGVEELHGAPFALNTLPQKLSLENGNELSISQGNMIKLEDNDPNNELLESANLNGSILELNDAGGTTIVDLSPIEGEDPSPTNELQDISTSGTPGHIGISNGSYITLNVDDADADNLNEIQDLNLNGDVLTITNNTSATPIDLSSVGAGAFSTTANITTNASGDYANDDFVFGSPQLDDDGNPNHDIRMFFDKSKGAFRVGSSKGSGWDELHRGNASIGIGEGVLASGINSTSIGNYSNATGVHSIAMGSVSFSSGDWSMALGNGASSLGTSAITIGTNTAIGNTSSALGYLTKAEGNFSTTLGHGTTALSFSEIAIGAYNSHYTPNSIDSFQQNDRLFVIGNGIDNNNRSDALIMLKNGNTTLNGELTIDGDNVGGDDGYTLPAQDGAANQVMKTNGNGSLTWENSGEGAFSTTANVTSNIPGDFTNDDFVFGSSQLDDDGDPNHDMRMLFDKSNGAFRAGQVDGVQWNTRGDQSVAMGYNTKALGNISFAFGFETQATAEGSIAMGKETIASGIYSTSTGARSTASGDGSFAMGGLTNASGLYSTTMGQSSTASNDFAFATGLSTTASGKSSTAMGNNSTASGNESVAMGEQSEAKGKGSFAVGFRSDASGDYSTAIGILTEATANYSTALGSSTTASGEASTSTGAGTTASGTNSMAIGWSSIASGSTSFASGVSTYARSLGETTLGIYATDYIPASSTLYDASDRLFVIGNGLDAASRSNALIILKNGDATLSGTLTETSDERLKKDISPILETSSKLKDLRGVHFRWNSVKPHDTTSLQTGFIAQEVEKLFPELVKEDSEGYKSVNYIGLIPHLVEAIKELKAENDQLKNELIQSNQTQSSRLDELETRLRTIENQSLHSKKKIKPNRAKARGN